MMPRYSTSIFSGELVFFMRTVVANWRVSDVRSSPVRNPSTSREKTLPIRSFTLSAPSVSTSTTARPIRSCKKPSAVLPSATFCCIVPSPSTAVTLPSAPLVSFAFIPKYVNSGVSFASSSLSACGKRAINWFFTAVVPASLSLTAFSPW